MKKLIACIVALVLGGEIAAAQQKEFKRETIEYAFAEMRKQTDWNLDGKLLWTFSFTAPKKQPLVEASAALEKMGYHTVSIEFSADKKIWMLQVEKIAVHTVDSLHAQNQRFVRFASDMKLGTYDGWDAAQVPDEKKGYDRQRAGGASLQTEF